MKKQNALADSILDVALEQAESSSWESVNLHTVAKTLDISLQEIKNIYPQKSGNSLRTDEYLQAALRRYSLFD